MKREKWLWILVFVAMLLLILWKVYLRAGQTAGAGLTPA
jgi:TRAP-type C4-dicarboxylate transport system permease small subunit